MPSPPDPAKASKPANDAQAGADTGSINRSRLDTEPSDDQPASRVDDAARSDGNDPSGTDVVPVSEDSNAVDNTLAAPSFRAPFHKGRFDEERPELTLSPGETIDDFEVVELIGRGAFGGVYLARQLTLDRLVALKITGNRGSEGRTLAQLEHDYIVRVFSETVDNTGRFRLLCMQLVPGASLEDVIKCLKRVAKLISLRGATTGWNGEDYLAAISSKPTGEDAPAHLQEVLDTTALRDRELLGRSDDIQTVAWVGARLAEAVDYAHQRGILHRDIKPANVLVNRYGRPLLADFNIAQRTFADGATDGSFGGTIAFMAPEHLDAFNPKIQGAQDAVDERSDLYSLGIVIYELMTGESPFVDIPRDGGRATYVGKLAAARRAAKPPIGEGPSCARKVLERTVARTLEPQKEYRYSSGARLAAALEGAAALRAAEREFPTAGWLTNAMQKHSLLWLALLVIIPQFISSLVNITYNTIEIGSKLNEAQVELFWEGLIPWYNSIAYPVLLGLGAVVIVPVFRVWSEVNSNERINPRRVDATRRRALRLPLWLLLLVALGWLPGGLIFPLMIDWLEGPIDRSIYAHFITSFTLSGLIAAAYSFAGLQFLILRVMYPRYWADATSFRQTARRELASSLWRVRFIPTLAYSIPVVAILMISAPPLVQWQLTGVKPVVDVSVLILFSTLALLGGLGSVIAGSAARSMSRTLVALIGREA